MKWVNGEAAQKWEDAVSDNPGVKKSALNYWARHLETLPGPILFTLTQTELLRGEWQRVVRNSEQRCLCGERRWFIPVHSQGFYEPDLRELIRLFPGSVQVAIGPWGGDVQSTCMQLSIEGDDLRMHMMPYSLLTRDELAALGQVRLADVKRTPDGKLHGIPGRGDWDTIPLAEAATGLAEHPAPRAVETGIRVGPPNSLDVFSCRLFGIYGAAPASRTLTIAVSRNFRRIDPSARGEMHTCR